MSFDTTVRLSIYNEALLMAGERQLANLSENREPRRLLDALWDSAAKYCLEQGQWNFSVRAMRYDFSPSVEPPFGYTYAFNKPDDWVRTCSMATDPCFNNSLLEYTDETGFWFCNWREIYVRYVSNDDDYGYNASAWPESYRLFVAAYLAKRLSPRLKNGSDAQVIENEYKMRKQDALSKDAMQDPVKLQQPGAFVSSRWGRRGGRFLR